jgi:hypothetical protein
MPQKSQRKNSGNITRSSGKSAFQAPAETAGAFFCLPERSHAMFNQ